MRITEKLIERAEELRALIKNAEAELKPILDEFKERGDFELGQYQIKVTEVKKTCIIGLDKMEMTYPDLARTVKELGAVNHVEYKTVKIIEKVKIKSA